MNGVRRLFAQASGSATATAVEQPMNVSNYDQKSSNPNGITWSSQNSSAIGVNGTRTIHTPSPPPSNPSKYSNNSPSTSSRIPSRQDSNPFQLDDIGTPSRSGSRTTKRKPSKSGHSKASSSLSRSLAYTNGSPPLPGAPVNTKDELIIELLASEAVVDSRDCEILGSEQVEQLKKVCTQSSFTIHSCGRL
jgi:hypothetical protein